MKKEQTVDYQDAVARYSKELSPSRDELVVLPEPAGKPVADYTTVSDHWKEKKTRMLRLAREVED